ncbi:MAG: peptidoglycan-binding domain-containing protein [Paracoccaceae bacterium]
MRSLFTLATVIIVTACTPTTEDAETDVFVPGLSAPKDAEPGTCWSKTETPAILRSRTETIQVQPAEISSDGIVLSPPVFRDITRPVILKEREVTWFQNMCAADLTPDFTSSLQRALEIRGDYAGAITGVLDAKTRNAIRKYQIREKIATPDPQTLTIDAARRMGLWIAPIPDPA